MLAMESLINLIKALGTALRTISENNGFEHAGNLAFLTLVAFLPFLLIFSSIAGHLTSYIGDLDINKYFFEIISEHWPAEIIKVIRSEIITITSSPPVGLITFIAFSAIWISSSLVEGLRTSLNKAYRVQSPPIYILRRMLSIVQCIILTCILVTTILIFATLSLLQDHSQLLAQIWPYFRYYIIPFMLFIGASIVYFIVPNTKNHLHHILPGAFVVVLLWNITAVLFIEYIKLFNQFGHIYGSIGSNILFLIFFYVLYVGLIYGAEFNAALKYNTPQAGH